MTPWAPVGTQTSVLLFSFFLSIFRVLRLLSLVWRTGGMFLQVGRICIVSTEFYFKFFCEEKETLLAIFQMNIIELIMEFDPFFPHTSEKRKHCHFLPQTFKSETRMMMWQQQRLRKSGCMQCVQWNVFIQKIENKTYKTVNLKHWCRWSFQRGELCCASCGNSHKTTNFLDDSWLQNLNSGIRNFRDFWNLNVFLFSFNSVYRTKILLRMDEFM